jgi:hypothetical protein
MTQWVFIAMLIASDGSRAADIGWSAMKGGGRSGGLLSALPKFPETIALGFHLVVLSLGADA